MSLSVFMSGHNSGSVGWAIYIAARVSRLSSRIFGVRFYESGGPPAISIQTGVVLANGVPGVRRGEIR